MSLRYPLAPSVQFMSPKTQHACRYNSWTALTKQTKLTTEYRNINTVPTAACRIKMSNQAFTTADSTTLLTREASELRAQTDDFMYVALCGKAPLSNHSAQTRAVTQGERV